MTWEPTSGQRWVRSYSGVNRTDAWIQLSTQGYELTVFVKPNPLVFGVWALAYTAPTLEEAQAYADIAYPRNADLSYTRLYATPSLDTGGTGVGDQGRSDP